MWGVPAEEVEAHRVGDCTRGCIICKMEEDAEHDQDD